MICDRFIHIHVPRTGGSLFRSIVNECVIKPGIITMIDERAHLHLDESVALAPGAKTVTIIRNPFDWYVSRYHRAIDSETFKGSFQSYFKYFPERGWTMTAMWNDYTDNKKTDVILRFEWLVADIIEFVTSTFPEVAIKDIFGAIHKLGKVRASVGKMPFELYYNQAMVNAVNSLDGNLLEEFGYSCKLLDFNIATKEVARYGGWY